MGEYTLSKTQKKTRSSSFFSRAPPKEIFLQPELGANATRLLALGHLSSLQRLYPGLRQMLYLSLMQLGKLNRVLVLQQLEALLHCLSRPGGVLVFRDCSLASYLK